ncbi:MAG: F0F1 ATP synthase subunit epsilon [Planctomycetota bacterium]|nr:F0F1 ATP synthase subunit epsilon [Planctomycetota bacterium]
MSTNDKVHCVVVTPEKTELDTTCDMLVLPLFDGELAIQPSRAPMVGRLGFGMMRVRSGSTLTEWFVDGGFVQVTRQGVNILTDRLLKPEQINRKEAEEDLNRAMLIKPSSPEALALKERSVTQAQAKIRLAK